MSSFIRRIERQVHRSHRIHMTLDVDGEPERTAAGHIIFHSNPPRRKFYGGRGSKLGVRNPKDKSLLARLAREAKRAGVRTATTS